MNTVDLVSVCCVSLTAKQTKKNQTIKNIFKIVCVHYKQKACKILGGVGLK